MKTSYCSSALIALLSVVGCTSLQTGGEVQYGRQALLAGRSDLALGYFYSAAQLDPSYVYTTGSSPRQSVWSYVGRTEYLTGRLPQARQTLERALADNREEDIARLYLGLTLAKAGDRQGGLKEIESGMRGINNFLNYINEAQRYSIGQYWDPDRDIRGAIQVNLAMIEGKDLNWERLTADTEWLGIRMEEESDLARRQEAQDRERDSGRDGQP